MVPKVRLLETLSESRTQASIEVCKFRYVGEDVRDAGVCRIYFARGKRYYKHVMRGNYVRFCSCWQMLSQLLVSRFRVCGELTLIRQNAFFYPMWLQGCLHCTFVRQKRLAFERSSVCSARGLHHREV